MTPFEALQRAQADQLSGQALIKQAFAYLLKMPTNRLIMRPGKITESQFTYGQYIQLSQAGRPVIQPLPIIENPAIPVILNQEDIQPAFEALEQSLNPNTESLHDHAVYLSAKELVDKYKANPDQPIAELLKSLSFRFSKTGYTGLPFSPANALCAQLAWLAVDKTKRNPQEQFWKLLIPEVTGTFQVMADAQWPAYGEALLDENLVSGRPGEIINYRLFYTDTQSKKELIRFDEKISEPLRDRIKAFYSGHFGFWSGEPDETQTPEFNNYYDFFISLMDFTFRNSVNHLGNNFEDKIHARSDEEFSKHYAQGLARYLAWHENLDLSSRKTAESMISPAGKVGLIQIIMNLLGQNFTGRCLNANSNDFKSLLHDNKDIEDYLKSIPFNLIMSEEALVGQDSLDYLSVHCLYIENLDFEGLIHELHQGKNIPMEAVASRFMDLPCRRNKAEDLFNFFAYINDQNKELALLKVLKESHHFPNSVLNSIDTYQYTLRLYDRLGRSQERNELLLDIHKNIEQLEIAPSSMQAIYFMIGLISAAHRDIASLEILVDIEQALDIRMHAHRYINSCRNYAPEINATLKYLEDRYFDPTFSELIDLFTAISEQKQKIAFNYYKQRFVNRTVDIHHLDSTMKKLPDLKQELYEALKEKIRKQINTTADLHNALKSFTPDQGIDFCNTLSQDKIKSLVTTLNSLHYLFVLLRSEPFALIFQKIDPALYENISIEEYSKFVNSAAPEKFSFIKEKLGAYFKKALDKALGSPRTGLRAYLAWTENAPVFNVICREDLASILGFLKTPEDLFEFFDSLNCAKNGSINASMFLSLILDCLPNLLKTTRHYYDLKTIVPTSSKLVLLNSWINNPASLSDCSGLDIKLMLMDATDHQRRQTFASLSNHLAKIILKADDISSFLLYANDDESEIIGKKLVEEGIIQKFSIHEIRESVKELSPSNSMRLTKCFIPIYSQLFNKSEDFLYYGNEDIVQLRTLHFNFYLLALKTVEILKLLAPDSALVSTLSAFKRTLNAFYEPFHQHYDSDPLLQKSWKLACIPDVSERITQTYQAVLETRRVNHSPEDGSESPRLRAVKKIFL